MYIWKQTSFSDYIMHQVNLNSYKLWRRDFRASQMMISDNPKYKLTYNNKLNQ